jgi:hypothetical protein
VAALGLTLEQGAAHLGATGVVEADEQDGAHRDRGYPGVAS